MQEEEPEVAASPPHIPAQLETGPLSSSTNTNLPDAFRHEELGDPASGNASFGYGMAGFGPVGFEVMKEFYIDYHIGEPVEMKDANITSLLEDPTISFFYVSNWLLKRRETRGMLMMLKQRYISNDVFVWLNQSSEVKISRQGYNHSYCWFR